MYRSLRTKQPGKGNRQGQAPAFSSTCFVRKVPDCHAIFPGCLSDGALCCLLRCFAPPDAPSLSYFSPPRIVRGSFLARVISVYTVLTFFPRMSPICAAVYSS